MPEQESKGRGIDACVATVVAVALALVIAVNVTKAEWLNLPMVLVAGSVLGLAACVTVALRSRS